MEARNLFGVNPVESVYFDKEELLGGIVRLYAPQGFDVVANYSEKGNTPLTEKARLKFSLEPCSKAVLKAGADQLPVSNNSVDSLYFENQLRSWNTKSQKQAGKDYGVGDISGLMAFYVRCLGEFKRVINRNGILVFPCSDLVSDQRSYFLHSLVYNEATRHGFKPLDIFICVRKMKGMARAEGVQSQSRKHHEYFWVFKKVKE